MSLRRGLRWYQGERGLRCEDRLLRQGGVAYATELGVPVTDLLHARLERLHTLCHKSKESPELIDTDVEHRRILRERFSLLKDAHSLPWSNLSVRKYP